LPSLIPEGPVAIVERAHPDLGRLGVFWQTQGSGKSYSMALFSERVRRKIPGNFTFLLMIDRTDLDDQIYKTFVGCGIRLDETIIEIIISEAQNEVSVSKSGISISSPIAN
jgi:type I restriction enzyme R subunit